MKRTSSCSPRKIAKHESERATRPERAAPAHRALSDPMQAVPTLDVPALATEAQAAAFLEEFVESIEDGAASDSEID